MRTSVHSGSGRLDGKVGRHLLSEGPEGSESEKKETGVRDGRCSSEMKGSN